MISLINPHEVEEDRNRRHKIHALLTANPTTCMPPNEIYKDRSRWSSLVPVYSDARWETVVIICMFKVCQK